MISKYREDKIKAEFRKLESDLKAQDQKNALERQRTKERRNYYEKMKRKTVEPVNIAELGPENDPEAQAQRKE